MSDCNCKCKCQGGDKVRDLTQGASAVEGGALQFHPSTLAAQVSACVSASYTGSQICVHFPVVGEICFSVSLPIPAGSSVKVCMETCGFRFGIPPFNGIKASVYFDDNDLWTGVIWGNC